MAQDKPREDDCIFCKITHHEDPKTTLLYEDDDFVAFQDLRPASQHHYLIVPKWHIKDAKQLQFNDISLVNRLEEVGADLLRRQGGDVTDVRMGFHWPPFHLISHLHLHVISPIGDMKLMSKAIFMDSSPWFVSVDWLKRRLRESEPETPDSESG